MKMIERFEEIQGLKEEIGELICEISDSKAAEASLVRMFNDERENLTINDIELAKLIDAYGEAKALVSDLESRLDEKRKLFREKSEQYNYICDRFAKQIAEG